MFLTYKVSSLRFEYLQRKLVLHLILELGFGVHVNRLTNDRANVAGPYLELMN